MTKSEPAEPGSRPKLSDYADHDTVSQADLQKIFGVSRTTLYRWFNRGLITPIAAPGRPLYRVGDIRKTIDTLPARGRRGGAPSALELQRSP